MKKLLSLLLVLLISVSVFAGGSQEAASASSDAEPEWVSKGTPLADVRVRQALRYAIDMDTICETLFSGAAVSADLCPQRHPGGLRTDLCGDPRHLL